MRRLTAWLLVMCFAVGGVLFVHTYAYETYDAYAYGSYTTPEVKVVIDGKPVVGEPGAKIAEIKDGRTLLGLRAIGEAMGGSVSWNPGTRTASIVKFGEDMTIMVEAVIDRNVMKVEYITKNVGKQSFDVALDVPAQIIEGRTMLPVRAFVEALFCYVAWDQETKTVSITTNYSVARLNDVFWTKSFEKAFDILGPYNAEGFAMVSKSDDGYVYKYGMVDKTGKIVLPIIYDDYNNKNGYVIVQSGDLYGLYDLSKNMEVIPTQYASVKFPENDIVIVKNVNDGNWYFYDLQKGVNKSLGSDYAEVKLLHYEGETVVLAGKNDDGLWYLQKKMATSTNKSNIGFDEIRKPRDTYEGIFAVRQGAHWGFIREDLTYVVAPSANRYTKVGDFKNGYAEVTVDAMGMGLINKQGVLVTNLMANVESYEVVPGEVLFVKANKKDKVFDLYVIEKETDQGRLLGSGLTGYTYAPEKSTKLVILKKSEGYTFADMGSYQTPIEEHYAAPPVLYSDDYVVFETETTSDEERSQIYDVYNRISIGETVIHTKWEMMRITAQNAMDALDAAMAILSLKKEKNFS